MKILHDETFGDKVGRILSKDELLNILSAWGQTSELDRITHLLTHYNLTMKQPTHFREFDKLQKFVTAWTK